MTAGHCVRSGTGIANARIPRSPHKEREVLLKMQVDVVYLLYAVMTLRHNNCLFFCYR